MNDPANPSTTALGDALRAIEADFPAWHCWIGTLPHLLYARRPMTSPPVVVRSATVDGLRAQVEATERKIRP